MLKSRVLSAIIGLVLLLGVVLGGILPLRIAIALVSVLMIWELSRAVGLHISLVLPAALLTPLIAADVLPSAFQEPLLLIFLLVILCILLLKHGTVHSTDAALCCLFTFFIGFFMRCITKIRMAPDGEYWIWLIFIGAWASDVFAYFSGRFWGKKKLLPSVSPKKTIAGAIGGVIGAALGFLLFGYFAGVQIGNVNLFGLCLAGLAVSVCGQIGDLVASVIKRQYGIKDYGKIMPGHGGAMDRFDSVLFVAPMLYLYMLLVL